MSLTFRKRNYDLSKYEICENCLAPIVQINGKRECLYEWLNNRCIHREVVDIVPLPNDPSEDEWRAVGVVLQNGFMIPVDIACLDYDLNRIVTINERLIGLEVVDVAWVIENTDSQLTGRACVVDLSTPRRRHVVTLSCNIDILVYMLNDELFRRVEP